MESSPKPPQKLKQRNRSIPHVGEKERIWQGGARNLSQAKPTPKQANLNKLADAGGSQIPWLSDDAKTLLFNKPRYTFGDSLLLAQEQVSELNQLQEANKKVIEEQSSKIDFLKKELSEQLSQNQDLEAQKRHAAAEAKSTAQTSQKTINDLSDQIAKLNYQIKRQTQENERLLGVIRFKEERIKKLESEESFDL